MIDKILNKLALTTVFATSDTKKKTFLVNALNQMSEFYDKAIDTDSEYLTGEIRMDRVTHSEGTMWNEPCTWQCTAGQYAPLFVRLK